MHILQTLINNPFASSKQEIDNSEGSLCLLSGLSNKTCLSFEQKNGIESLFLCLAERRKYVSFHFFTSFVALELLRTIVFLKFTNIFYSDIACRLTIHGRAKVMLLFYEQQKRF
jgi:hypothetical protein